MDQIKISPIKAFTDNYIWCLHDNINAIIIDPGEAGPVEAFLIENNLKLEAILITHWHFDHIGGVEALLLNHLCKVFGPDSNKIPIISDIVNHKSHLNIMGLNFDVIEVPGHTLDHIAFYCPDNHILFCGDTLFAGGCGRMFEGSPEMFYASLKKLASLPLQTDIFCAHEYTISNLNFALEVEPENLAIKNRLIEIKEQVLTTGCSLPSKLSIELKTNPFLRVKVPAVIQAALINQAKSTSPVDIFAALRDWKNNY